MTNAEKYLKDGVDIEELANELEEYGKHTENRELYSMDITEFFKQKTKQLLSEDEKVILKSMPHLKSVSRSRENDIWVHYQQKQKYGIWGETIVGFNYLFQFIQPRRRI